MKTIATHRPARGYTLIEALVAGVVLMAGIAAAAQLTLTLLTQEEISRRSATAINHLENAASLYSLGFNETEIIELLPETPGVDRLRLTPKNHDLGGGLGELEGVNVAVEFNPSPADSSYAAGFWSAGETTTVQTAETVVYRSVPSISVP